jgi:phosphopantetheine adenylyltransferase
MNFTLDKIDTVFFISRDDIGAINASIVREIFKSKGRIDSFVSCSEKLV